MKKNRKAEKGNGKIMKEEVQYKRKANLSTHHITYDL